MVLCKRIRSHSSNIVQHALQEIPCVTVPWSECTEWQICTLYYKEATIIPLSIIPYLKKSSQGVLLRIMTSFSFVGLRYAMAVALPRVTDRPNALWTCKKQTRKRLHSLSTETFSWTVKLRKTMLGPLTVCLHLYHRSLWLVSSLQQLIFSLWIYKK